MSDLGIQLRDSVVLHLQKRLGDELGRSNDCRGRSILNVLQCFLDVTVDESDD